MMTRQHFERIAAIIAKIKDNATRRQTILDTVVWLRCENPGFNVTKFEKACGW